MNNGTEKKPSFVKRIYDWVIALSGRKSAFWALGAVSFAESSFFPVPPDALLLPMCLAKPKRSLLYAAWCTFASVLGGIVGYMLGLYLFGEIVHPIAEALGWSASWFGTKEGIEISVANLDLLVTQNLIQPQHEEALKTFLTTIIPTLDGVALYSDGLFFKGIQFFLQYGWVAVFIAAFTPIPYKVFTISAGFFGLPIAGFVFASVLGRGGRFFFVSGLVYFFGPKIEPWIRRNIEMLIVAFTVLIILGFAAIKML